MRNTSSPFVVQARAHANDLLRNLPSTPGAGVMLAEPATPDVVCDHTCVLTGTFGTWTEIDCTRV